MLELWDGDLFCGYIRPEESAYWRECGYTVRGDVR